MAGGKRYAVRASMATRPGRARTQNEDACYIAPERGVFVVSDGIGGQAGGAIASQLVVGLLPALLERTLSTRTPVAAQHLPKAIAQVIGAVSSEVRQRGRQQGGPTGMGATVALLLLAGSIAYVSHLGDSRVYLLRQARLSRLTVDHTVSGALARLPQPAPDAPGAPGATEGRHLSRYVGMEGQPTPDVRLLDLHPGDRLLLCSDGLYTALPDRLIAHLLRHQPAPDEACRALLSAATSAGGRDDATAVVVFAASDPP